MEKKDNTVMEKWGNWQVFLIGIGFLCIIFAPQMPTVSQQMVMIIGGLMIVLIGVIILKKAMKKERRKNGKW